MSTPTQAHRARLARLLLAGIAGAFVAGQLLAPGGPPLFAMALAAGGIAGAIALWDRAFERIGPRHLLDLVLPFGALVLLALAVRDPLDLPGQLRLVTHPLLGASLGLGWLGASASPESEQLSFGRSDGLALVGGGLTWVAAAEAGLAGPLAYLGLVVATLAVWRVVWPVRDPVHPGPSPLRPHVPWGEIPGRPWPAWRRIPLRAPATLGYLVLSWVLFGWLGHPEPGGWGLDTARYEAFLYEIPDLSRAPLEALASLLTAPFLNHDHVQLIYVTALLGLFGLPFEVREGTARAAAVFAVTGLAGALVAGIVLHPVVSLWPDVGWIEHAWTRTWSGGSVGAFGLMGALSARARRPGLFFGFFVFWELNVGAWVLRSYTPMFHLTALATGYLLIRRTAPRPARSV